MQKELKRGHSRGINTNDSKISWEFLLHSDEFLFIFLGEM
jgi:hypothetical protein